MTIITFTEDGASAEIENERFERMDVIMSGNFGGGTLTWSKKWNDDGAFRDIPGAAYTAADAISINSVKKSTYKVTLAGATAPNIEIEVVHTGV